MDLFIHFAGILIQIYIDPKIRNQNDEREWALGSRMLAKRYVHEVQACSVAVVYSDVACSVAYNGTCSVVVAPFSMILFLF